VQRFAQPERTENQLPSTLRSNPLLLI